MKDYIPFVYRITNKTTGLKYIGVKYAKGCHTSDLWTTYFTSSHLVEILIELFGKEDWHVEILHEFLNDPVAAVLKEASYLDSIRENKEYLNLCYSSGIQDLEIASKGGKIGGIVCREKGLGILNKNNPDYIKWRSNAGKLGGKKQVELRLGIHAQTVEERLELLAKARQIQNETKTNRFAFASKEEQSERGKRGGIKHAGSKRYNDGIRNRRYNSRDQIIKPFEDFLNETGYSRGYLPKNSIQKESNIEN